MIPLEWRLSDRNQDNANLLPWLNDSNKSYNVESVQYISSPWSVLSLNMKGPAIT